MVQMKECVPYYKKGHISKRINRVNILACKLMLFSEKKTASYVVHHRRLAFFSSTKEIMSGSENEPPVSASLFCNNAKVLDCYVFQYVEYSHIPLCTTIVIHVIICYNIRYICHF